MVGYITYIIYMQTRPTLGSLGLLVHSRCNVEDSILQWRLTGESITSEYDTLQIVRIALEILDWRGLKQKLLPKIASSVGTV